MLCRIFSSGCPLRSNIANMKAGSIATIMIIAAALRGRTFFNRKNSGTPIRMPIPKQTTWRLVRLKRNLVLLIKMIFHTIDISI